MAQSIVRKRWLVVPGPAWSCQVLPASPRFSVFPPRPGLLAGGGCAGPACGGLGVRAAGRGAGLAAVGAAGRGGWRFWPFPGRSTAYSALTG